MKYLGIIALVLCMGCASSQNSIYKVSIPNKLLENQELNDSEKELMRRAIQEHDRGNYSTAVDFYTRILQDKPNSALTLHEIALSENANGNFKESMGYTLRGQKIDSEMRFSFYHMQGINLDYVGKTEEAIKAFKESVNLNPNFVLSRYSLAITYTKMGEISEAKESLKAALQVDVSHASSHLLLGRIFQDEGKNVSALFAYTYFLFYESDSPRTQEVYRNIGEIFNQARLGQDGKVSIGLNLFGSGEMEDTMVELLFSTHLTSRFTDEKKDLSEIEFIAQGYEFLLDYYAEKDVKENEEPSFIEEFYLPYFSLVHEHGYTKAMVYLVFQNSTLEGVTPWIDDHWVLCEDYLNWEPYPDSSETEEME